MKFGLANLENNIIFHLKRLMQITVINAHIQQMLINYFVYTNGLKIMINHLINQLIMKQVILKHLIYQIMIN
mgnify:CR=1 FL=1